MRGPLLPSLRVPRYASRLSLCRRFANGPAGRRGLSSQVRRAPFFELPRRRGSPHVFRQAQMNFFETPPPEPRISPQAPPPPTLVRLSNSDVLPTPPSMTCSKISRSSAPTRLAGRQQMLLKRPRKLPKPQRGLTRNMPPMLPSPAPRRPDAPLTTPPPPAQTKLTPPPPRKPKPQRSGRPLSFGKSPQRRSKPPNWPPTYYTSWRKSQPTSRLFTSPALRSRQTCLFGLALTTGNRATRP